MHFFVTHQGYMKIDFSKIKFGNDGMQKAAHVNQKCGFPKKNPSFPKAKYSCPTVINFSTQVIP